LLRFGGEGYCCLVDDFLRFPEEWVRDAVERRAEFAPPVSGGYPGISLALDPRADDAMREFFTLHMRRYFNARRIVKMLARYSLVTLAPEELSPSQRICHQDPGDDPNLSRLACTLYLFHDEALGGTSFYEPTRSFAETARLFTDAKAMTAPQFTERYGIQPSYLCDSNAYFRRTATVPARWNRAVFYSGALLHSGQITAPERMTADPATGRLTVNFFFSCRRNLAAAASHSQP